MPSILSGCHLTVREGFHTVIKKVMFTGLGDYLAVIGGGYFTIPVYFSQFLEAILLFLAALSTMLTHRPALERLKEIRSEGQNLNLRKAGFMFIDCLNKNLILKPGNYTKKFSISFWPSWSSGGKPEQLIKMSLFCRPQTIVLAYSICLGKLPVLVIDFSYSTFVFVFFFVFVFARVS